METTLSPHESTKLLLLSAADTVADKMPNWRINRAIRRQRCSIANDVGLILLVGGLILRYRYQSQRLMENSAEISWDEDQLRLFLEEAFQIAYQAAHRPPSPSSSDSSPSMSS